jgi:hypothetical protein
MDKIWTLVETYGLSILVIAISIIAFIGILKLCKVFNKIQNKDLKKFIYYALDIILAFGGSAIYFACFKDSFAGFIVYSTAELTIVTTLYALYEYCGARKLVKFLIGLVAKWVKKNPDAQLSKWANKIGLKESIEKLTIEQETKNSKEKETVEINETIV